MALSKIHSNVFKLWDSLKSKLTQLLHNEKKLKTVEWCLAAIGFLLLWFIFSVYTPGGPNSSDVSWYFHVGMNNIKDPFILNRYFHVFLQRGFIWALSDPIRGFQVFWAFLMATTSLLVYVSARLITKTSTVFHALFALLIFLSMPAISEISGVPFVDVTAMMMIMATLTVYLLSVKYEHSNPLIIVLLGIIFFLSIKTKETTLPIAITFMGLGWVNRRFSFHSFLKNTGWLAIGVLCGFLLFGILNGIILGDPLWGIRPSDIRSYFQTYVSGTEYDLIEKSDIDWYRGFWFSTLLVPFLLYIFSGLRANHRTHINRRLIWAVPLAFILFIVISINNNWGMQTRFVLPILPLIAVLASQSVFHFEEDSESKGHLGKKFILGFLIGVLLLTGIRILLRLIVPSGSWNLGLFITLIFNPVLLSILFGVNFLVSDNNKKGLITAIVVFGLLTSPMINNVREMAIVQQNNKNFNDTVYPLTAFKNEIVFSPDIRLFVDDQVFADDRLLIVKNADELFVLFNIVNNANATSENFSYYSGPKVELSDYLLEHDYDYFLLTSDVWATLQNDEVVYSQIVQRYQQIEEQSGKYVLLRPIS